jgi:hypothetical protein
MLSSGGSYHHIIGIHLRNIASVECSCFGMPVVSICRQVVVAAIIDVGHSLFVVETGACFNRG